MSGEKKKWGKKKDKKQDEYMGRRGAWHTENATLPPHLLADDCRMLLIVCCSASQDSKQ